MILSYLLFNAYKYRECADETWYVYRNNAMKDMW